MSAFRFLAAVVLSCCLIGCSSGGGSGSSSSSGSGLSSNSSSSSSSGGESSSSSSSSGGEGESSSSSSSSGSSSSSSSSGGSSSSSSSSGGGQSLTIQENETGFCGADGSITSGNAGYTGTGAINLSNSADKAVVWNANVPADGTYTLNFRYSKGGSGANTEGELVVNGSASAISFTPQAFGNSTWQIKSADTLLNAGVNDIRIRTTLFGAFADIDYLEIVGESITGSACSYP